MHRSALAATGLTLALIASPAAAQDYYYEDDAAYAEEVYYEDEVEYAQPATMCRTAERAPAPCGAYRNVQHHAAQQPVQRGYSEYERSAWLDECTRRVKANGSGTLIGGLAGAAVGGVIGNRVAGRGDRLGGTLIGAGVGGLAGAAIGNAVDGRDARNECEAYLADYEANWRAPAGHHGSYGHHGQVVGYTYAVPMMVVRVPVERPRRAQRNVVVEEHVTYETVYETEVVEVPVQRPASKRTPVRTVPVKRTPAKRTRYVK
ncbi:glycine zipper 2TM domain-containing protein [Paraurantiacibacter namhicola]|uniref:17 kDa surface antigen n=1 Tax=Paraurantiacibacter namhicola TaxID=645517 RepID=A0A1C7D5K3_9SPHN|nr:glycine zipper 2TM domain-containing protein [Paraurantiacibacter namhicola]ANU06739.1 hypothetical protein A6F65_00414 [Paraurantiacibacter namhicola]